MTRAFLQPVADTASRAHLTLMNVCVFFGRKPCRFTDHGVCSRCNFVRGLSVGVSMQCALFHMLVKDILVDPPTQHQSIPTRPCTSLHRYAALPEPPPPPLRATSARAGKPETNNHSSFPPWSSEETRRSSPSSASTSGRPLPRRRQLRGPSWPWPLGMALWPWPPRTAASSGGTLTGTADPTVRLNYER